MYSLTLHKQMNFKQRAYNNMFYLYVRKYLRLRSYV